MLFPAERTLNLGIASIYPGGATNTGSLYQLYPPAGRFAQGRHAAKVLSTYQYVLCVV